MVLAAELRRAGVRVDLAYGGRGLKGAMKAADRSGARFALVLGDRDLEAGQVGLKDLATGEQAPVRWTVSWTRWSPRWARSCLQVGAAAEQGVDSQVE